MNIHIETLCTIDNIQFIAFMGGYSNCLGAGIAQLSYRLD
jgi:hypothetical protein